MGNAESYEQETTLVGYRVLGVQPNSPASSVGLVSFFDFVVAANNVPLKVLDSTFVDMIRGSEDKPLPCTVYNIKSETVRDVSIVPSRNWGGQGMLGVTIRFDTYFEADQNLVRVLDIAPGSPAEIAGLTPEKDYLLGTAERVFKDPDALFDECTARLEEPIEMYVYNVDSDEVRVAVVMPTTSWGGEGCLGAHVGYGYLHRLPNETRQTLGSSVTVASHAPDATAAAAPVANGATAGHAAAATQNGGASVAASAAAPPPPPAVPAGPAPPVEHEVVISKPCSEEGKVVEPRTTSNAVH